MDGKLATIVLNRAVLTPTRLRGRGVHYQATLRDMRAQDEKDAVIAEDIDDGEDDAEVAEEEQSSDADAEVAEEEEAEEDDEGEVVGAVKTRTQAKFKGKKKAEETEESEAENDDEEDEEDDDSSKSAEEDWEAADDDAAEDLEAGNATGNRCV